MPIERKPNRNREYQPVRLVLSIPEVMAVSGLCRVTVDGLVRTGKLSSTKVGSKTLIPISAVNKLLGLDVDSDQFARPVGGKRAA